MRRSSKILVGLAILMMVIASFTSCKTAKDAKAKNRVLSTPELLEQVGREWEKRNPCVNDTVLQFTPGDTLIVVDTVTETRTEIVTRPGETSIQTVYKTVIKTVTIHDTIKAVVEDTRRLRIANDSINYYRGVTQQLAGNIAVLKDDVKDANRAKRKWQWAFWILLLIAVALLTRKIWGRFLGLALIISLASCNNEVYDYTDAEGIEHAIKRDSSLINKFYD